MLLSKCTSNIENIVFDEHLFFKFDSSRLERKNVLKLIFKVVQYNIYA